MSAYKEYLAIRRKAGNLQASNGEMLHAQHLTNVALHQAALILAAAPRFEVRETATVIDGLGLMEVGFQSNPYEVSTETILQTLATIANGRFDVANLNLRAATLTEDEMIRWGIA